MSSYTIRAKLLLCLGLFAAAFVTIIGTLHYTIQRNKADFATLLTDRIAPMSDLKVVADAYAVQIVDASHKARNGNFTMEEAAHNISEGRRQIAEKWQAYEATSITGNEAVLAQEAKAEMTKADAAVDDLQAIIKRGDRAQLDDFVVHRLYPAIDPVSTDLAALVNEQLRIADQVARDAGAANRLAGIVAIVIGLIVAGVWIFAFQISRRAIIRPIQQLADTMEELAGDRQDTSIPFTQQKDEIGRMARACEIFRIAAIERTQAQAAASATQRQVTSELQGAIAAISRGDLTQQIANPFPPEYEAVRHDFNGALAKLRELIGAVSESAATIRTGSGEIAQASEDLARRTEGNAASLEQTSAAIAQMTDRLRNTSSSARSSLAGSQQAMVAVEDGRSCTDDAVQAMGRVSESAKGIDNVIEGLDKIAFQTRVLAMNAAVEAGRAGDAGRGFAVVADLVSALAMRAEEEAKAARDQLTATQMDISSAVDAVSRVDRALADIHAAGGEASRLAERIAADNEAQSAAIAQISTAIGTMDQATQQNAAMVEQTSAAARSLAGEVDSLADKAGRFDVGVRAPARKAPTLIAA